MFAIIIYNIKNTQHLIYDAHDLIYDTHMLLVNVFEYLMVYIKFHTMMLIEKEGSKTVNIHKIKIRKKYTKILSD